MSAVNAAIHRGRARAYRRATALSLLGDNPFQQTVRTYARNLTVGTALVARVQKDSWLSDCDLLVELVESTCGADDKVLGDLELRAELKKLIREWGRKRHTPPAPTQPVDRNLRTLARLLRLSTVERQLLQFAIAIDHSTDLRAVAALFLKLTLEATAKVISVAIAQPEFKVLAALRPRGRLIESGLLEIDPDLESLETKLSTSPAIRELVFSPRLDRKAIMNRFLPVAMSPTLTWADFQHIAAEAGVARDLLRGALRERRRGINVLLYGPTGTGKTELARLLAQVVNAPIFLAGQDDKEGEADDSFDRITSLRLGSRLVGGTNALMLFDELEDLFEWRPSTTGRGKDSTARMQKRWFNTILEENAAPTIWISNAVGGIDPAFLRRFAFAIEVPALGAWLRARVLRRHLGSVPMPDADVDAVAERYEASPAQFGSAVAAARLATDDKVDRPAIESVLAPIVKLVSGVDASRVPVFDTSAYDIDVLNSPDDLVGIAKQLAGWKPSEKLGVSLCLYGPSGTGKSEYVKYLAHSMGRRVLYKRVSDLQSPFVGVCEQNIAKAFRDAERDDAVLLLDEADSFLSDRAGAVRSYEVSQTNEFLMQLEAFRGIVACTTNLFAGLDPASLRRFIFKLRFEYMRPEQSARLFQRMFGDVVEGAIDDLVLIETMRKMPPLGPGDFAAVARRVRTYAATSTVTGLMTMLRDEAEVRHPTSRRIGY